MSEFGGGDGMESRKGHRQEKSPPYDKKIVVKSALLQLTVRS